MRLDLFVVDHVCHHSHFPVPFALLFHDRVQMEFPATTWSTNVQTVSPVGAETVHYIADEFASNRLVLEPIQVDSTILADRRWKRRHVVRHSRHGVPVDLQFIG